MERLKMSLIMKPMLLCEGWNNFCREQVEKAINRSHYSVVLQENGDNIAMGRIIGDGLYFTIVDVVVRPDYQGKWLGTLIIQKLIECIEQGIPAGGGSVYSLFRKREKSVFMLSKALS